jgi:outer membrane protein OmpA-like peptidoglycan-associated protein
MIEIGGHKMFSLMIKYFVLILCMVMITTAVMAEERFVDSVGRVSMGSVKSTDPIQVPFITWGGDMATFYANGGLTTKSGTIFNKLGLNLRLVQGDNFIQQVRNYLSGESPFLRGTFRMMGLASEAIGQNDDTKGVVILQMTWSAGDHMVVRQNIKQATDLAGKKVVLQKGGPHVGMLDDILKAAKMNWDDISVIWADDLTGSNGPAEKFRSDSTISACFVISPDMIGLTGGLQNIGSGAEGTVKGARVLISTAQLSRSIADVYVCRKDFYDAHKSLVEKFVAGYLKACEEVVQLKKEYETKGSARYMELLKLTQSIYGADVIPTLEEDAHGLLSDCTFVGYPGNVKFFTEKGNPVGFEAFQKSSLDLAVSRGYAIKKYPLLPSGLDYDSSAFVGYLSQTSVVRKERFKAEAVKEEVEALNKGELLDEQTLISFTITFEPNQTAFSEAQYGNEFQRVVELASKFGNAVIVIRGHSDPTLTLVDLVKAGMQKGILKRSGTTGDYKYYYEGSVLDLKNTQKIIELIQGGAFDGAETNPRQTMQVALNLSASRAEAVRDAIVKYATNRGQILDASQITPVGVGIREPLIAKPGDISEARQNMRVEFRLVKVPAEVMVQSDFDF